MDWDAEEIGVIELEEGGSVERFLARSTGYSGEGGNCKICRACREVIEITCPDAPAQHILNLRLDFWECQVCRNESGPCVPVR